MIVETYSRLSVQKDCLNPNDSVPAGGMYFYEHGGGKPYTVHVLPFEAEKLDRLEVPDYFRDREVSDQRNECVHYRFPSFVRKIDDTELTRSAILATSYPAKWKYWRMSAEPALPHIPEDPWKQPYQGDYGWDYTIEGNNTFIVMFYEYMWDNGKRYPYEQRWTWSVIARKYELDGIYVKAYVGNNYNHGYEKCLYQNLDMELLHALCKAKMGDLAKDWQFDSYIRWNPVPLACSNGSVSIPIPSLFDEKTVFDTKVPYRHKSEWDWLQMHAFYDACSDIEKANENMIQNITQVAKFLIDVCRGKFSALGETIPKYIGEGRIVGGKVVDTTIRKATLRDVLDIAEDDLNETHFATAWMAYRYSYSTTKSDLQQFSDFLVKRCDRWLAFMDQHYYQRSYGFASLVIDGIKVESRCKIAWRPAQTNMLKGALKYLHDSGLEVNPYVLWDMIPLSFIVDWFLPVGDFFEVTSNAKYYTDEFYDFDEISFSIKYETDLGTRYLRLYTGPPLVEGYAWLGNGTNASPKTIAKRVADTGALIDGILIRR